MSTEPLPHEAPDYAERQREVQRWIGRCLLESQKVERLLKAFLHASEVKMSASVGEAPLQWQEQRRFPQDTVRNQSLGQLVAKWFDGVLVPADAASSAATEDEANEPSDVVAFRSKFSLHLDSGHFAEIKSSIELMVRERNELVHHLIERFDLWTLPGCDQALDHLQALHGRMEQQYVQLKDWAVQMDKAREHVAEFMRRPAWVQLTFFTDPEQQPHRWVLLQALMNGTADEGDWVPLDAALQFINTQPVQCGPSQLGLNSWYQVLKQLPGFEVVRRRDAQGHQKVWFRFHHLREGLS